MQIRVIFPLLLFISFATYSQDNNEENIEENRQVIRLSILAPGVLIEQPLKNNFTIVGSAILGFSVGYSGAHGWIYELFPTVTIEPRYYNNTKKRKKKGKSTSYFSGTYFGLPVSKSLDNQGYSIGILYGFQNCLGKRKRGFWNIGIGYGYGNDNEGESYTGLIGDLGIGIKLPMKN